MRRTALLFCAVAFLLFLCATVGALAQQATTPQTARQALLEMFFSKTPGVFVKHLPAATRAAFDKSGSLATLEQYSIFANQIQSQGHNFQTYDTGSILLAGESPQTGDKFEVTVANDALNGDQDDITLSFQTYKAGQLQRTPFMPEIIFSMKQEAQVWKLNEISVTVHLPLADPDFLKAITEKMKPHASATITPHGGVSTQSADSDAMVIAAIHTILTAEQTYAVTYPNVGYTCTLSDLDGFGGGEPNAHQAMLINSGLASGKKYGYVFALSRCGGSPSNSFLLTAAPSANSNGRKSFCADHSGIIRSSADGNPATCMSSGVPAQ